MAPVLPLKKIWLSQLDNTAVNHLASSPSSGGTLGKTAHGWLEGGFRKQKVAGGFLPDLGTTEDKSVQGSFRRLRTNTKRPRLTTSYELEATTIGTS